MLLKTILHAVRICSGTEYELTVKGVTAMCSDLVVHLKVQSFV